MILLGAKKHLMGDVAQRLEKVQQKVWTGEKKTAEAVFASLKLGATRVMVFLRARRLATGSTM